MYCTHTISTMFSPPSNYQNASQYMNLMKNRDAFDCSAWSFISVQWVQKEWTLPVKNYTVTSVWYNFSVISTSFKWNGRAEKSRNRNGHVISKTWGMLWQLIVGMDCQRQFEQEPCSGLIPSHRISSLKASTLVSFRRNKFVSVKLRFQVMCRLHIHSRFLKNTMQTATSLEKSYILMEDFTSSCWGMKCTKTKSARSVMLCICYI